MAETGWSKEFPQVDGDYLCRINEHDLSPVSFRMENGAIYEYGCGKNLRSDYHRNAKDYEFLGPFAPSDFEELVRLRETISATVEDLHVERKRRCGHCEQEERWGHLWDAEQRRHVFNRPGDKFNGQHLECGAKEIQSLIATLSLELAQPKEGEKSQ